MKATCSGLPLSKWNYLLLSYDYYYLNTPVTSFSEIFKCGDTVHRATKQTGMLQIYSKLSNEIRKILIRSGENKGFRLPGQT